MFAIHRFVIVLAAATTAKAGMTCPGSGSFVHASCEVDVSVEAYCADVMAEMKARASGEGGWVDPHNGGIYTVISSTATELRTQRTSNPAKAVGGKTYVDKQVFTFSGDRGSCNVQACSESQGFSVSDFSTNYCDIRNLYAGTPVHQSLSFTERSISPSMGAGKDASACVVKPMVAETAKVETSMTCPGSGSFVHASCEVDLSAETSCANVMAEMKARATGEGGWVDPHNGGIYTVISSTATELRTQRTTNPAKAVGGKTYVDKQVFTFSDVGGKCNVQACSESQSFSVADFSTNYCDIRNLYAGTSVHQSISFTETSISPSMGAGKDASACVVGSVVV